MKRIFELTALPGSIRFRDLTLPAFLLALLALAAMPGRPAVAFVMGPPTVSVQCVDWETHPDGMFPNDLQSLWWEVHFNKQVRITNRDLDLGEIDLTSQDDTVFAAFMLGGGADPVGGDGYDRIWRWGTTPKVSLLAGSALSDVSGVVVSVPAGGFEDEQGNANTASGTGLYLAHNWKVSVADANAEEGTDETLDFEVTLNARDDCKTVSVDWATVDGTAVAGEDYTAGNGTLTFGPGETVKTVSVEILDDTISDSGETFTLQLSNAVGVTIADAEATGTIFNSESPFNSSPQIAGVAQVGNTLAVAFTQAPSGSVTYQWLRGSEEIAGATAGAYTPVAADVGEELSVRVHGGDESLTSAATAPVWPAAGNPPPREQVRKSCCRRC